MTELETQGEAAAGGGNAYTVPLDPREDIVLVVGKPMDRQSEIRGVIVSTDPDPDVLAARLRSVTETSSRVARIGQRLEIDFGSFLEALEDITSGVSAGVGNPETQLSENDLTVMREAGLFGASVEDSKRRAPVSAAVRYAKLLSTSLTVRQAAERLDVSDGRIRQRLSPARTLYGFQAGRGWCLPAFQFTQSGTLPGLERVLPQLPDKLHPTAVEGFFTRPNRDLRSDEEVSVAEWLASGGDPQAVVELARDLLLTP